MIKQLPLTMILLTVIGFYPTAAQATNWVKQGKASTGELVLLDLDSVRVQRGNKNFEFTYRIGPDTVAASVNCPTRKVYPDGYKSFIPNSGTTTDRMVNQVCEVGKKLLKQKSSKPSQTSSGLPLQIGIYRQSSSYIQIANQGDRLCYRGFSVAGATTASLIPDPNQPDSYRISGRTDTVLRQETNHSILFGSIHQLNSIEADYDVSREVGDVLQDCLNSRDEFYQEEKTRFQRPGN
jgi:hypothetical protein